MDLRLDRVSRAYHGVAALQDVTLELAPGEVLGLVGPNGAGKTTLIDVVTGYSRPTEGRVLLGADDVTEWSAARRARAGLARTFQTGRVFGGLTVRENMEVAALGVGARPREAERRADRLLADLQLTSVAAEEARTLPHGAMQKVGLARALATEPRFVLMDEPAAGLAELELPPLVGAIRRARDHHGTGVLLVDHNMGLVLELCDRIHVLDQGRTLATGTPDEIRRNVDVTAAYLGESGVMAGGRP
jgi:branched-chain amino acid transport system ATP-binding protein